MDIFNQFLEQQHQLVQTMAEISKDSSVIFRVYNGLANLLMGEENYTESLDYFHKTLSIIGITASQQSRSYCDLGVFYFKQMI